MDTEILDKDTQEKLIASSWLRHHGTKIYEGRIRDVMAREFTELNNLLFSGKPLLNDDLVKLNKTVAKIEALKECLMTKLSIEELVQTDEQDQ